MFIKIPSQIMMNFLMNQHWHPDILTTMFSDKSTKLEPEFMITRCPTIPLELVLKELRVNIYHKSKDMQNLHVYFDDWMFLEIPVYMFEYHLSCYSTT
jgi:hypothetical protein